MTTEKSEVFTPEELSRHNGKEGPTIYVAHDGEVYDLSESKLWKMGKHMNRHSAGTSLTDDLKAAPHGPEVLARFPQIGTLKAEEAPAEPHLPGFMAGLFEKFPMLRRHPHPMTVHYPIAFVTVLPLFLLLFLITKSPGLELTAYHALILTVIAAPVAMVTGPLAWWVNYGAIWTTVIKLKFLLSALLMVLLLILLIWRSSNPGVMVMAGASRYLYFALSLLCMPVIAGLGWLGAKMTFPE